MEKVQQRFTAVIAALALVIGCALVFAMPQQAEAKTVQLKAGSVGSTSATATNIILKATKNNKNPSMKIMTTFNTTNDNNWYKFTTSDRDSTYNLKLKSYKDVNGNYSSVHVVVYDSTMHRFWTHAVSATATSVSIPMNILKRNQVYYIEVWRYATDSPEYQTSNDRYADYALTLTEEIRKPGAIKNLKVKSTKSYRFTATYSKKFNADGYQIQFKRAWSPKNPVTQNRYTDKTKRTYKTAYAGSAYKYKVRVRPYRLVDGKKFYGPWNKVKNSSGVYKAKYVKVTIKR